MLEALRFAAEAIAPIIVLVLIGYFLKRIGMVGKDFAKAANKLVFRVFLPASLFLSVYRIPDIGSIEVGYIIYALAATLAIFLLAIPAVCLFTKHNDRRGPTLQATFRSNFALVGIPLAGALFGTEGTMIASLLSAAVIPLFNVLAVISLSLFSGGKQKPSAKKILLDIAKNPLILSIATGIAALAVRALLVRGEVTWRLTDVGPLMEVLSYLASVATPLALLALGMQFEFSTAGEMRREIAKKRGKPNVGFSNGIQAECNTKTAPGHTRKATAFFGFSILATAPFFWVILGLLDKITRKEGERLCGKN